MGFGLVYGSGGTIVPFCKYDSKSGRFKRVDRVQDSDGKFKNSDTEIFFQAIVDVEHVEKGFMRFIDNQAPQHLLVSADAPMPPKPQGEGWKPGYRAMVKLDDSCGGDVRELTSNAQAFCTGFDKLGEAYEAAKAEHPGMLPVVEVRSTKPVPSGGGGKKSTNYMPIFSIVGWVVRPADLKFVPKAQSEASKQQDETPDYDPTDDPEYYKSLGLEPPL
jgi:hypothetical protein